MDLIENSTVFLYPVVRAMFDHIYGDVFFGPNLFVYPIVDTILRNLYVNEVATRNPEKPFEKKCRLCEREVKSLS